MLLSFSLAATIVDRSSAAAIVQAELRVMYWYIGSYTAKSATAAPGNVDIVVFAVGARAVAVCPEHDQADATNTAVATAAACHRAWYCH